MKKSKWIWCAQNNVREYNQTVLFKKEFTVREPVDALLKITADSWYRVLINGKWINDGPARAYPNHWQYDELRIGSELKKGTNRIDVIVRYFGVGTFHQIPQQAGLRAELHIDGAIIGTDTGWFASPSAAWNQWTPKASVQMEPVEEYDARLANVLDWKPTVEVKRSGRITPRNTGLLTKTPLPFKKLRCATVVKKSSPQRCVPVARLAYPGLIEAGYYTSRPVVLGSVLTVRKKQQFDFASKDWKAAVNGRLLKTGKVTLSPGRHTVLFFCTGFMGHQKEIPFPFLNLPDSAWGLWNVSVIEEFLYRDSFRTWVWFNEEARALEAGWQTEIEKCSTVWKNPDEAVPNIGTRVAWPEKQIFLPDSAAEFAAREPVRPAGRLVNGQTVMPSGKGDLELCYDLGKQSCGYFEFVIKADAGVIIDAHMVEYITPDGTIQHTMPINRNGMRYITRKGINRFTSLKRRAGQYLFITLRNQKNPVEILRLRLIESTAPVEPAGAFECSDPMLNKVWKISERTVQLCMEDTFTDCPLYEQTLWIGDARNEALYAFTAYGNYDVSARSLELGAQSLEHFPIVGCQVPSSWDCLLPAWSFLWGIHVWEHYFYSGNKRLLKKLWPAVLKNLEGTKQFMDSNGLFSAKMWNLLDWSPIDHLHPTVLHNSMLLVGAFRAAENCAQVLNDKAALKNFGIQRKKLVSSINRWWNTQKNSYPDALLENGNPSPKTCQHTSMLAIMCDIAASKHWKPALSNLLNPPKGMTVIGSPFVMQFMYEALEKAGEFEALLNSIQTNFKPMINAGASTVWEMFAGSDFDTNGFPTRSHCHAWSSSPIYFLNRIVLGIRQTAPGGKVFQISPWLGSLTHAHGATATPNGPVAVEWKLKDRSLNVTITAPKRIKTTFVPNTSHPAGAAQVIRKNS
jgi:hypothetical protein